MSSRAISQRAGSLGVMALALAAGVAAGCGPGSDARASRAEEVAARQVRAVAAVEGTLPREVVVTGTLGAEEQVELGMKVSGRLLEISVDLGSRVRKGEPLARLIPTDAELRVAQAEAALQQARARLGLPADQEDDRVDPERTPLVRQGRAVLDEARASRERAQALFAQELLSRSELDAAEAAFQVADSRYQDALDEVVNRKAILAQRRSELELARQQVKDSVLYAPFDGAVRERQATPGAYLAPGDPVVTLVRMHPLRLRLAVPERDAAGIRSGQEVSLTVEGDPRAYAGRVARLSPAIDERSRTLMLEAEVPNQDGALRPGSFATATIEIAAAEPAVLVPDSALVTFAGIEKVLAVRDGKAVELRVRTGRRHEGRVEIAEGLTAGEQVVLEPGNLVGGEAVTVMN